MKNFVFRVDASLHIGSGHVMRCLTLADALAAKGMLCTFICRDHSGHLIELIRSNGYAVYILPMGLGTDTRLAHAAWLGATQKQDAQACTSLLVKLQTDWLVVDHYALDARWESELAKHCTHLMVIDDLADRPHICNLLLDQTFKRDAKDYRDLVPENCTMLCGSSYALLRPEFAALRPQSLQRRVQPQLKRLLITMGGVDKDNITAQVLNALRASSLPTYCEITVVMGPKAPWLADVYQQAQTMPWPTTVRVGVSSMAQLMADSDLCIGAGGATTWERCCLGLPTVQLVLAVNQKYSASLLKKAGAVKILSLDSNFISQLGRIIYDAFCCEDFLKNISIYAQTITDGKGCERVVSCVLRSE